MIIEGKLNLTGENDDYTVFGGGRNVNISDFLNIVLMEDVYFKMTNTYSKEVLVDTSGLLIKKKIDKCFYLYHIGDVNIDRILWNNVGRRVKVEVRNITERFIDADKMFEEMEG